MKKQLLAPSAAALALALLSAPSPAQFGGAGGRRGGSGAPGAARNAEAPPGPQTRASQVSEKLYELRARLQLTAEQTPPWQAVYDQVWDLAARGAPGRPAADDDGSARTAAPQALRLRAAAVQEQAARLQKLAAAVDQLCATMTPEQRQMVDQSLPALVP